MIEAVALSKSFGTTTAVHALDLSIRPGEVFCLLGANGAGKTTTINLFLNFIAPSAGEARVCGLNVVDHPLETKKKLSYIPEQVTLYRNLTGLENLRFFTRLAGTGAADSDAELLAVLAQAGLTAEHAAKRVSTYSKGMRQKVMIMCAFLIEPPLYIADEPFVGLDPLGIQSYLQTMDERKNNGSGVLMSTHILATAERYCDRFVILHEGKIRAMGTLAELRKSFHMPGASLDDLYVQLTKEEDSHV